MNELLSISDGTTLTYDEVGNTLTKTDDTNIRSYTYNVRNQLNQVEKNQHIIAQYEYDGDGRRISKTEWIESLQDYQTTMYIYAGAHVIYEKNLDTNQDAVSIYGPLGRIAKEVDDFTDYYHTDHVGSTRVVTDESGSPITDVIYKPFGEEMITGEGDSYLYSGKELDTSGLYYFGARYYDPEIGRFTTRDPLQGRIKSPQTQNRYVYCLNNPLKYVDPQGMDCVYVILPDGTISYEMAKFYNLMQKGLEGLSDQDWEDINELLGSGDPTDKIKAVKKILEVAGIESQGPEGADWVSVTLGEVTFTIQFAHLPVGKWGSIEKGANVYRQTILISDRIFSGGDLFLVLGHELAHAYMVGYHGDTLESVMERFSERGQKVYMEFISYQWQLSILNKVPNASLMYRETVESQYRLHSLLWFSMSTRGHIPEK